MKSFDTIVVIATTSSSIMLSLTGIGLIVIPISSATACGLAVDKKVVFEIITNKCNKNKKQYERDQQTIESCDKLYRNSSQANVFDKNEYESLCNIFTKYLEETKNEPFFIKMNFKIKLIFFQ